MNKKIIVALSIIFLCILCIDVVHPVGVSRIFIEVEGYPGDVLVENITLRGTLDSRKGFWSTSYREREGDSPKMDITNWITITPNYFEINKGESISFEVKIQIPSNANPGLHGAIIPGAGRPGYIEYRRSYIDFVHGDKAAMERGNGAVAKTGFHIPVIVNVLGIPCPFKPYIDWLIENIIFVTLIIIILLLILLLLKKKDKKKEDIQELESKIQNLTNLVQQLSEKEIDNKEDIEEKDAK